MKIAATLLLFSNVHQIAFALTVTPIGRQPYANVHDADNNLLLNLFDEAVQRWSKQREGDNNEPSAKLEQAILQLSYEVHHRNRDTGSGIEKGCTSIEQSSVEIEVEETNCKHTSNDENYDLGDDLLPQTNRASIIDDEASTNTNIDEDMIRQELDLAVLEATSDFTNVAKQEKVLTLAHELHKMFHEVVNDDCAPMASFSSPLTTAERTYNLGANVVQQQAMNNSSEKGDKMAEAITKHDSSSSIGSPEIENELYYEPEESSAAAESENVSDVEEVDVAIVGAGIGGLCAGAILNTLYDKKVGIYESHYLPGGCAHAFDRAAQIGKEKKIFTFDSGPTIVLGCSAPPYNPLRQVMNAVGLGDDVEWIRYDGWGMIENVSTSEPLKRWKLEVGEGVFEKGPLAEFGGPEAMKEWEQLREVTKPLVSGAVDIPAMAMRPGQLSIVPLLRYFKSLVGLISQGETVTGTFDAFMNGPIFKVTDPWLRNWLDALAFSLSGLPASRTAAAAMAYILFDMHRDGTALDYPKGGLGTVIDTLVKGVEQGDNGSKVNLRRSVQSIDTTSGGGKAIGLTLRNGKKIKARDGVICNAPVWSLRNLLDTDAQKRLNNDKYPPLDEIVENGDSNMDQSEKSLLSKCDTAEMTRSFLHLHLALDASGLDLDALEPHYTVMDQGLCNDPCGELNMIAVSNPCVIDRNLAPEGYIVVHAYGAGNEPYEVWEGLKRGSSKYEQLKESRAKVLWKAVESIIPDARDRAVLSLVGSPITHERFLRRPNGTYGVATEDLLKDGSTPIENLVLCGDGIFPGIGVPAVAVNGASAANAMVGIWEQWQCMDELKKDKLM